MKPYPCLILDDSLSDQLAIEIALHSFDEIEPYFVSTPHEFRQALSQKNYQLLIVDIQLQGRLTGIDLLELLQNPTVWVILYSAYEAGTYYGHYQTLPFVKFYLQKPLDEYAFRTHIESFLFTQKRIRS
jgi:DNA-binding NtrC family response regulator